MQQYTLNIKLYMCHCLYILIRSKYHKYPLSVCYFIHHPNFKELHRYCKDHNVDKHYFEKGRTCDMLGNISGLLYMTLKSWIGIEEGYNINNIDLIKCLMLNFKCRFRIFFLTGKHVCLTHWLGEMIQIEDVISRITWLILNFFIFTHKGTLFILNPNMVNDVWFGENTHIHTPHTHTHTHWHSLPTWRK